MHLTVATTITENRPFPILEGSLQHNMPSQILGMAYETRNCVSLVWDTIFPLFHPFQDTAPGSMVAPRTGSEDRLLVPNPVDTDVCPSTKEYFLFFGRDEAAFLIY